MAKDEKKGYSLFGQPKSRPALTRGEDRIIAGVCSGIAERIDADAVLVRVTAVVLLVCTFGLVAVPYIAFAAFLPTSGGEGKLLNVSPLDVCSDRYHRVVEAGVARGGSAAKLWHPCRGGPYTSYAACVFGGFSSYAFSAYAKRGG